jgi:hypothetical protein
MKSLRKFASTAVLTLGVTTLAGLQSRVFD